MIYNSIEKYLALKPRKYKFLQKLSFSRDITEGKKHGYDVELVLCDVNEDGVKALMLRCGNVSSIEIGNVEGMPGLLVDIEDICHMQMEDCSYRVSELEEKAFTFDCEYFSVEILENN